MSSGLLTGSLGTKWNVNVKGTYELVDFLLSFFRNQVECKCQNQDCKNPHRGSSLGTKWNVNIFANSSSMNLT